jgi:hypothetical protein
VTGLFIGEWVYNFAPIGLLALVPILAWFLGYLDGLFVESIQRATSDRRRMIVGLLVLLLCAAVADLAWSGVHTYIMRVLTRVPAAILLVLIAGPFVRGSRQGGP